MDARTRLIELIQAYAGGGGAPTTATYVTLSTNGTLTNERVLTAGTGITVTDAGAGSTVTVAVTAGTYQPLDADLTTLAATTSTDGHVWRRAGGTWAYGTLDHSALSAVAWTSSGHTGTASRVAAFDVGGAASYLQVGVDLQAYSATLASIAAGTWTGATSITTLGTIATGTWQGTAIAAAYLGSHTHAAADITSGVLATARLGSGSASSSTYLRGDQTWSALSASDITTGAVSVAARLGWLTTASTANTTDATNGTTTNTPSWSVTSGKNYLIEVEGTFDCAASTNGFRCRLEESGGASSSVCAGQVTYSHASGIAAEPITAAGTWTTAGTGSTSRAGIRLCVHYHCTGTGTLSMGIRPETAGSAVNLYSSTLYRMLEK